MIGYSADQSVTRVTFWAPRGGGPGRSALLEFLGSELVAG